MIPIRTLWYIVITLFIFASSFHIVFSFLCYLKIHFLVIKYQVQENQHKLYREELVENNNSKQCLPNLIQLCNET